MKEKLDFSFDVSALGNYTEEPAELIKNAIVKARTAEFVTWQAGIKSSETLNIVSNSLTYQAGGSCGWNATGSTPFTQRTISVCKIKVQESMCLKDLEAKFTQKLLSPGSNYSEDDIPQIILDDIMEQVSRDVEYLLWRGNTSTGTGINALCNGFNKLIDDTSTTVRVSSGTSWTGSNGVTILKAIKNAIPENIRDASDLVCFMGRDWFESYQDQVFDLNNRWVAPEDGTDGSILFSNIPIVVVPGLTGQNRIVCTTRSNMYVGTDLEGEYETVDLWYSTDNREHRLEIDFKIGVQFAFPENVVYYAQ